MFVPLGDASDISMMGVTRSISDRDGLASVRHECGTTHSSKINNALAL
jgi:hypothetical protein